MNNFLTVLLWIYLAISQIMSLVFFIEICGDWDNIVGIIIAGPVVSEFQGLLWPFFI